LEDYIIKFIIPQFQMLQHINYLYFLSAPVPEDLASAFSAITKP
jgi:hypothetical protein